MRVTAARGLTGLLVAGLMIPLGAQPGSAFTGTVIANANVLNGSVTLLAAATVNIATVARSQYPGTPSAQLANLSGLGLDAVASAGVVQTAATADPLYDTANSSSDLASLNVASGLVSLGPTHSQCVATGSGVTASSTVTGLVLGGGLIGSIPTGAVAPNTTVPLTLNVLGIPTTAGSIILNYQSTANQGAGQYSTKVVAARIVISVAGLANVNLDVGTSECGTKVPTQPAVSGISPVKGPEAGGTSVTVTGSGFLGTTDVKFGSTSATSYTINSLTSITAVAPAGTSTTDVRVVNPAGTSANTAADDYTYVPRPVITAVAPVRGPTAGGTTVTITGTNLTAATAVSFGGTAATGFSVDSATQITAVAPAGSAGQVDVRVTTVGGQSTVVTADQYTYVAVPAVTNISPSVGTIAGGTSVTITGTALDNATAVKFGSASGTITNNTGTSITVTSPAGSAGVADVLVTTAGGTSADTAADNFTYVSQPTVTNVSPGSGAAAGGTSVTITGTGFAGLSGAAAVKFGGTNATSYTVNSATSITAVAPAGSAGTVDVTVTNPAGTSAASAADQFTYVALPTVTNVTPATGPIAGGNTVTITGTGFTGAPTVSFGTGNTSSLVTVVSPTQITATVPGGSGSVDVRVTTTGGTSPNTGADDYLYAGTPTVTNVSPGAGPVAGATNVTITGTNLTGATAVRFGGTNATSFTVTSATSITAVSPAGSAGAVDITVVTPGGTSATSANDRFTYTALPVITSITPNQAPAAGGALSVTINGSNFTGATAVKFDNTSTTYTVVSDTQITLTQVPAHAVGPVYVSVTTPDGGTTAQTPGSVFTYVGAPTLTTVSPASGPTAGGNTLTLTGTGFTNVTTVDVGPTAVTSFTKVSDTQITLVAPAGAAGTVNVSVTGSYGTSGTRNYQYLALPTVTQVSPAAGPTAGATTVTLTGTGFTGATQVQFDSVPGTTVTVSSDTSLTVTAPAHAAGPAEVTVIAPGGTSSTAGSANDYTYVAAPVITAITPNSGPTGGLNSVTITGTGFTGTTSVSFGGNTAPGASAGSDTSITVPAVPAHPVGDVTVVVTTTDGGASSASAGSTYTYLGAPTLAGIAPDSGPLAGGNQVVLTGTGFNQATSVDFGAAGATFTTDSDTQITATVPAGTGTVNVTVTAGASGASNTQPYTYVAAPVVTTVAPQSDSVEGGKTVIITGTGFTGATDVKFGTTSSPGPITVNSATQITATAPAHAAGTVAVTVVAPGGTSAASPTATDFTYIAQPVVGSVSPTAGPNAGGTSVTISGSGFTTATGASAVQFDGVNATSYTVNSDTSITAVTPAHGAGPAVVTVTTPDGGTSSGTTAFTYLGAPAVTGVSPGAGTTAGATTVTISGAGFTPGSTVSFGATPATNVVVNSSTSITATAPAGTGTVDVRVTTAGGTSPNTAADNYAYVGTPVVSGLAPTAGGVAGGESVSITGSGFTGVTGVDFGGTTTTYTVQSDTLITATAPAHAPGAVNVHVTTTIGGVSANQAANQYTYVAAPVVTALSPSSGTVDGGTTVTITGTGFTSATGVKFGNMLGTSPNVVSNTQMTVVSPAGAAGTVNVTVVGVYANSGTSSSSQFTYLDRPDITGVAPDAGTAAGGTEVTISGTGFTPASTVAFGATPGTGVVYVSATQIRVTSPAGVAGLVDIAVTTNGGTSATGGTRDDFRYVGTPTITGLSPTAGAVAGGDTVTIDGTQFYDVTGVTFGGVAATNVNRTSATRVTVTTPPHAAGAVSVVVSTTAGGASAGSTFTYEPAPAVTTVTPDSGPTGGATTVTLAGSGFTGATQVSFGTVPATGFTVDSDTQITATSPASSTAGTFYITVDGPYGTSATGPGSEFTYAGSPTVSAITPTRGALAGGTEVTVTGTGFTSGSTVSFGGNAATVVFVSATELRATTPAGSAGTVTMTVNNGYGTSAPVNFAYVDIPAITALSPSSGPQAGGTAVVITGSGFTGASAVRFGTDTASFSIISDTQIQTTSPGGTGSVNVRVVNDGGISATGSTTGFDYVPPPAVTGLTPGAGPIGGGTTVTITGTGFTNAATVRFGSTPATSVTYVSATQLTAVSPAAGSPVTASVSVTTVNGTSSTTGSADDFAYVGAPSLSGVSPSAGALAGGTIVTISGNGFTGATGVFFGGVAATSFTVSTDGSITATAPAGTAGAVDITVAGPGGTSATGPNSQFRYQAAAAVSGISPDTGSVQGGVTVTITGSGFTGTTDVTFGATSATSFTVVNDSTITVVTPSVAQAGARTVRVLAPGGTSPVTPAATYTYVAPPTVGALSPAVGPIAGGTSVTITGTGFTAATAVAFGTTTVTPTVTSDSTITVTTPAHAAGPVDVSVTGPSGTAVLNNAFTFLAPNSAPVLSAVDPARGPVAGGNQVTLTGFGFTGATAVTLGGVSADFTVVSNTEITLTVPAGAEGTVTIRVTTPEGSSTDVVGYTYVPLTELPQVLGITPDVGPVAGGTPLTITGANFDEQTTVLFDGVPGTGLTLGPDVGGAGWRRLPVRTVPTVPTVPASIRATYSNTLTVISPAHEAGPVTVQVTNAAGTISFVQAFTFIPLPSASVTFSVSVPTGSTSVIAPQGDDYLELGVDACSAPTGGGSVEVGPRGLACVYTAPGSVGTDSFTIDVTDAIGQASTQTVQVTVTQSDGTGNGGGGGNNGDGDGEGDGGGTGSGGGGGNDGDGTDGGTGSGGGGGNDGDGSSSGSGSGSGPGSDSDGGLAFTGTPYFLIPAISGGLLLMLFGTGLISAESRRIRVRARRREDEESTQQ
ncbi:IPT/TIG domain-containing protein [Kineosporia sp. NBRC 101731]|uniref:beta strand repeat-containing protein n=1 Tax=Kineosporia sp. NBRC 101731 TaxID=3032199 RepID=UPI0025547574|nr:IPT/TIG domain-containing protein [Kineosporia sp. NBRC 101731]